MGFTFDVLLSAYRLILMCVLVCVGVSACRVRMRGFKEDLNLYFPWVCL